MPDCRNHDRDPEFRYGSVLASRGGSLLTSAEAQLIVERIAAGPPLVRRGDTFHVMIELKRSTDADALAACALDAAQTIRGAAAAAGVPIAFLLESFEPDLLGAVAARGRSGDTLLAATFYLPFGAHTLADFDPAALDVVDVHPRLTSPADLETYEALGLGLALWTDRVTPAVFAAFERMRPAYIGTNQVELVNAWLDGS